MRIAQISNTNVSSRAKWVKKNNATNDLITKVNQKMLETRLNGNKLTPMDKVADMILNKNVKKVPKNLKGALNEFNALSKNDQDILLLSAKCRKD